MASVLAKRLKSGLNDVIHESQNGFMPGCHIADNIRLILDLVYYKDLILDDSLILFLDY